MLLNVVSLWSYVQYGPHGYTEAGREYAHLSFHSGSRWSAGCLAGSLPARGFGFGVVNSIVVGLFPLVVALGRSGRILVLPVHGAGTQL